MQTEHVIIKRLDSQFDRVEDVLEKFIGDNNISDKDGNRLRLLTEEALSQVKAYIGEKEGIELWIEGNRRVADIVLTASSEMLKEREDEIISLSSTGTNQAKKGFIEAIKGLFSSDKASGEEWSMADYQTELLRKREKDPFSLEAWEDMERNVLVKMADDISISLKGDKVVMVVTKDFTGSLYQEEESTEAVTPVITIECKDDRITADSENVEDIISALKVSKKDSLHMLLLYEEATGMLREMAGDYSAILWYEKFPRSCNLKMVVKTDMNIDKKMEMLSLSSTGKNDMARGIMSKISDIVETGLLSYDDTVRSGIDAGLDFSDMGMYSDLNSLRYNWSLNDYRNALSSAEDNAEMKAAWDELEKSIVGNVATDIVVGIKKDVVKLTFVCKLD